MSFVVLPASPFEVVHNRGKYRVRTGGPGLRGLAGVGGVVGGVIGTGVTHMTALTQAEYDALLPPDPTTFYIVID